MVGVSRHGVQRTFPVHILVARAFLGPPPAGMVVCHGPGRMLDNRLVNLSYGTQGKNCGADKRRDGTISAKLTEDAVREIRARVAAGESRSSLARSFSVSIGAIALSVKGGTWRHVPIVAAPARPPRMTWGAYGRIARQLESAIKGGELPEGTKLPSLRAIAAQNGVSAATAFAAVAELRAKGLVVANKAGRSFVARIDERKPSSLLTEAPAA
jgi:Bacterial regulatory proteins, gntR family/HNH endonuclease